MASSKRVWLIFVGGLFLSFHYALIIYVNSSFLNQFMDEKTISYLYIFGSILSVILFLNAGKILQRLGNLRSFLFFLTLELASTLLIFFAGGQALASLAFLLHQAVISFVFFNIDIFLEREQQEEDSTGNRRGAFLTFQNTAWICAPILSGFLVNKFGIGSVYMLASLLILPPAIIIAKTFGKGLHKPIKTTNLEEIYEFLKNKRDLKRILFSNILLQFFYAVMVIFMPIFLTESLGFDWQKVGIIFAIMLLPFLILEWPLGYIADHKLGEREILGFGFIVMAVSTMLIPFTWSTSLLVWAGILFVTRVGASSVEIGNEAYFFRQVKERDAGIIGIFRTTRPLAYIIAPLFASIILNLANVRSLFALLAIITLLGLLFIPKKDTR